MAEAILTLSQALNRAMSGQVIAPDSKRQAQVRASLGMAVNVLARQAALKAAKRQLQAQGLRPSQFSHRELTLRAEACLAAHRAALIADAKQIVDRWQAEGFFGKRARLKCTRREGLICKGF